MPYLSPTQARLRDDIRGLIQGEVRCDEITLQLYSTDAGILQCRPQGVVWPRNVEDVIACVRYASEKGLSIHARGLGTGSAGESLGTGIVLDFTRFMRRIVSLDRDSVTVQPGVIRNRLNHSLKKTQRRHFGPVSGFSPATTIGSILSRNGAGSNWLRYGLPSDHLKELHVVLANGEILRLNREMLPRAMEPSAEHDVRGMKDTDIVLGKRRVARGIALARGIVHGQDHAVADEIFQVLTSSTREIEAQETRVETDRCGYYCKNILKGSNRDRVDLARLLTGSEGTLGLIVEAKLNTVFLPHRKAAAVLFFNSLENAIHAVGSIFSFRPVFCELIDRRRLSMIRDWMPRFQRLIPNESEAVLLIELDCGTIDQPGDSVEIQDRLSALLDTVQEKEKLCFHSIRVETPTLFELFDEFFHRAELALFRMRRSFQPLPLFDDLAVPVASLHDFVPEILDLLRRHEVTASISGHVGHGHLRVHPIIDLAKVNLAQFLRVLSEEVYSLVLRYHGTIASEGGTGLLKSRFVPRQFPELISVFRNIKEIFDPDGLFNPGKVVPDDFVWSEHLRSGLPLRGMDHETASDDFSGETVLWSSEAGFSTTISAGQEFPPEETEAPASPEFASQLELQLKWEPERIFESAYLCNGCGDCLQIHRSSRMCPIFRNRLGEEASPRSKANLLRGVLEKELELSTLTTERTKEIADLCFHCQMCSFECPAEVDASHLAFRCKSAYVAAHGMPLEDLFFSRIDQVLHWFSMVSCPVNWSLTNRFARWILEKLLQIPQERRLPKLANITFLRKAQWSTWLAKPKSPSATKVALFVDTFANHIDPKLADLAVKILEHNGIAVHVPPRQRSSGLTAFTAGNMHRAEQLARHNSLLLADLIRQGFQVVALEPASASCLTKDYRYVVDGIDAALIMSNVVDFCDFLIQLHRRDELKFDFRPLAKTAGYHAPCRAISCSTQRVEAPTPAEELLRLIPELDVRRIEQGCCGMAGTYGFKRKNHRRALQIGLSLFREFRKPEIELAVSDCNSCCMQIEHGAKRKTWHPIRLLAAAYGLAPDVFQELAGDEFC